MTDLVGWASDPKVRLSDARPWLRLSGLASYRPSVVSRPDEVSVVAVPDRVLRIAREAVARNRGRVRRGVRAKPLDDLRRGSAARSRRCRPVPEAERDRARDVRRGDARARDLEGEPDPRGAADRLVQWIVVTVPAAAVVAAGPAEAHVDRLDAQRGRVRRHPVDAADDLRGAPAAVRVEDLHRVDLRPRRDANDAADGAVVLRADDAGDERAVAVVVLRRRAGR